MNEPLIKGSSMPVLRLVAYSAPVVASTFLIAGTTTILPGIYAKFFGLPLASIAAITLLVRVTDAVIDPAIGYVTDRWHARGGSRRRFALIGLVGVAVCGWFFLAPPRDVGTRWFAIWFLLTYAAWSCFEIPHNAWGAELATGYTDRARLYGYRSAAFYVGTLVFFAIPFLPIAGSRDITPHTLRLMAAVGLGLTFTAALPMLCVPARGAGPPVPETSTHGSWVAIFRNRLLLAFVGGYFLAGLGLGMWSGLLFLYLDTYLKLGSQVALVFGLSTPIGLVAIPVWVFAVSRFGKRATWVAGTFGLAVCLGIPGLLRPGPQALVPLMVSTLVLVAVGACQAVIAPSVLADIADYGRWRFGQDRLATYYAMLSITAKAISGVGAAAALGIAGGLGFDPSARTLSPEAIAGLKLAFAVIPAACVLAALPMIWSATLTPSRLALIRERLARRSSMPDAKRNETSVPTP
jgi:Na+/melibiose symporter-like transporter